jgi:photosystem I reaction center subunit V
MRSPRHLPLHVQACADAELRVDAVDGAGFTLIDVMGWGSLGHALAYAVLATSTNGYDRFLQ